MPTILMYIQGIGLSMPYALFVGGRGKRSLTPVPVANNYWLIRVWNILVESPKHIKVVQKLVREQNSTGYF